MIEYGSALWTFARVEGIEPTNNIAERALRKDVLGNGKWKGRFVCDAYAGYHALFKGGDVVPVSCWAHVRRRFFDAFQGGDIDAAIVLTLIARLYRVEAGAKERGLGAGARRTARISSAT